MQHRDRITEAFAPSAFKHTATIIIELLTQYLELSTNRKSAAVLPNITPQQMLTLWDKPFTNKPDSDLKSLLHDIINRSNHLHHPRYVGHQVTSPLPLAALMDGFGSLMNNASAVYEMGPVNTICEKRMIRWMAELIGYDQAADGVFTSGGTLGNLTALLAARQTKADYDIWTEGVDSGKKHTVLVCEQCHYSIKRAVAVMGLGEQAAVAVPTDSSYHMDITALKQKYAACINEGRDVFAVVANGCSTATGSFDDLERIADFCQEQSLWLHVDGAHGASVLLSQKYRHLLKEIQRADSIVWDAHKMLLMPALITAVIFRNGRDSYRSFSQKASYLFEKESHDEWYNFAQRTMECTKYMMGIKLYVPLMIYGTDFFADYVTSCIDLTKEFANIIRQTPDFELGVEPQCNIICFRYTKNNGKNIDELQKALRKKVLESERFYIVQTQLKTGFYLRCTIINPLTTIDDLKELLELVRKIAKDVS